MLTENQLDYMALCRNEKSPDPEAMKLGHTARFEGKSYHQNPYLIDTYLGLSWRVGWNRKSLQMVGFKDPVPPESAGISESSTSHPAFKYEVNMEIPEDWYKTEGNWYTNSALITKLIQENPSFWSVNAKLKYINLRIDTRDGHFGITDRNNQPVRPTEILDAITEFNKRDKALVDKIERNFTQNKKES